jgi:large subunit ribosomal protein L29
VDLKELRECNEERLVEIEKQLRREIFDARLKNFTDQLNDTASIRRARRNLARVKTLLRQKEQANG